MTVGGEAQFPQSEEVLRQALQDYAVVTLDASGRIATWSDGAERIFGWKESDVVGRTLALLFTPEDQAANEPAEQLKRSRRGERPADERWQMRKDGEQIYMSGMIRAIRSEAGEIAGFSQVAREITAQKLQEQQRETALRREQKGRLEAERRWKCVEEVFENLPGIVALVRLPERTVVFANRCLRQLVRGRKLIGQNIRQVYPAIDKECLRVLDSVAVSGERSDATERLVPIQGERALEERYFDFTCQPMRSETGDFNSILISGVDVTDRVQARWETEAENERLKIEIEQRRSTESIVEERTAIVEEQAALLDWVYCTFATNTAGTIEFWNPGAERLYGWRREEAIGRNVHELLRTESSPPVDEIEGIVFSKGEWQGELKHFTRSGKELVVSTRWVLWKHDGTPAGWFEIAWDITQHKQMEERLRQADKLESLGVLASGIAHDFNNILTGILGNISLTMRLVEPGSRGYGLLRNAAQATERAAMLTKQMLAYAGKGEVVVENINVSAVVRKTMRLIGGSIPGNVRVELALDEGLPPVRADEMQLEQVVMNLFLNAAEAIGDGGGKVAVRTGVEALDSAAAKPYDIGEPAPGRYIVLEVVDSGVGIDASIKPNIFDPFFTTKFTGRGLGLAALSGIVRALKGGVLVESTPGLGTVFRVLLPASGTRAEAPAEERATEQQYPILVVDNEEVVRQVAEEMLRERGYEVVLATDGQEALNVFRERNGRIALVLLDMTMPGMSGEEAFRQLKAIRADIPVILSSGFPEQEATRRFGGLGVADFLQKPYTSGPLLEKIEKALNVRNLG